MINFLLKDFDNVQVFSGHSNDTLASLAFSYKDQGCEAFLLIADSLKCVNPAEEMGDA